MNQLKLFAETIEKISLIANSPRKAFYRLYLETNGCDFFIKKQWGCEDSKLIKQSCLLFTDEAKARKKYNRIIRQKTNPNRKSKRIYKVI